MIYFEPLPYCIGIIRNGENKRQTRLIQLDWDAPGVASSFGWNIQDVQTHSPDDYESDAEFEAAKCDHDGTDGTIKCPKCGLEPGAFISSACEYLNEERSAEYDPGYFEEYPDDELDADLTSDDIGQALDNLGRENWH
jgi:hypothetical protein